MTYRAMSPGKLNELNASTGARVTKGQVIARVTWTDELGRPAAGGTNVVITAPADGTVEVFVMPNSRFLQNEALFRVDPDDTAKGKPSDGGLRPTLERALAAAMQNNWGYAGELCKQVLDAHPTDPVMQFVALKYRALALGFVGYQTGDRMLLEEALIEGRRAVTAFQRTSEPQQNSAGAYKAVGNAIGFMIAKEVIRNDEWPTLFPEGVAALKKAVELDPEDAQARKHLGIMYSAEPVAKMHGAKKSGGCFVATAACGDPFAPEVIALSAFRDDVLLRSRIGRALVCLYYTLSPPVAVVVARFNPIRRLALMLIVRPAVVLVGAMQKEPKMGTIAGCSCGRGNVNER